MSSRVVWEDPPPAEYEDEATELRRFADKWGRVYTGGRDAALALGTRVERGEWPWSPASAFELAVRPTPETGDAWGVYVRFLSPANREHPAAPPPEPTPVAAEPPRERRTSAASAGDPDWLAALSNMSSAARWAWRKGLPHPCPSCGAKAGERCVRTRNPGKGEPADTVHTKRVGAVSDAPPPGEELTANYAPTAEPLPVLTTEAAEAAVLEEGDHPFALPLSTHLLARQRQRPLYAARKLGGVTTTVRVDRQRGVLLVSVAHG